MRTAAVNDTWRHIHEKKYSTKVNKISISSLHNFLDQTITFKNGITALCGLNGIGKSTILNAIFQMIIKDEEGKNDDYFKKIKFDTIQGEVSFRGSSFNQELIIEENNIKKVYETLPINVSWIDSSYQVSKLIRIYSNFNNLEETLEAVGPISLNPKEIEELNYILKKDYSECEFYELEINDQGITPYFKVKNDGFSYGIEEMGQGEVAALYFYWKLKSAPKQTVFLIEEPETYFTHISQKNLMNVIAKFSEKKDFSVILTTHSSAILTKLPVENIKVLVKSENNKIKLLDIQSRKQYLFPLGLVPRKHGILLVEDRVARILLKHWLSQRVNILLSDFDVVDCHSKSVIEKNLQTFPSEVKWLKIYGVLDGDQIGKMSSELKGRYAFLPGTESFEDYAKYVLKNYTSYLSDTIGIDKDTLHMIATGLEGQDKHDWFMDFSEHLGISMETLISKIFDVGLEYDLKFKKAEEEAYENLMKMIGPLSV